MSENLKPNEVTTETAVSRREFGAVSLAAGLAVVAGAGAAEAADHPLTETEVTVKTPDGNCDAAFIHPTTGAFPGVLIWPDAFGLRPVMRQIARRIASEGYSVLVPNPFYRTAKAPVFDNPSGFNFDNPEDRAKLPPLTGPVTAAGAAEKDAIAYVAFLDAQKEVDKAKKIGTQGYCMGGALVVRTAAAAVDRIGRLFGARAQSVLPDREGTRVRQPVELQLRKCRRQGEAATPDRPYPSRGCSGERRSRLCGVS